MADTRREEQTRRFLSLLAGRLAQNRWMLAAGALAVLAVALRCRRPATAQRPPPSSSSFVVAMLAPRRTRSQRQADRAAAAEGGGLDGLSAAEPRRRGQRSADHFRRGGHRRPRQRRRALGLRRHRAGPVAADEVPRAGDAVGDRARALGRRRIRSVDYVERVPIERVYKVTVSAIGRGTGFSSSSSRTRAKRGASTACAPTSSPMPATSCVRRSPRSRVSSRRCAARPRTTPRRATISCRSCRTRRRAWRG